MHIHTHIPTYTHTHITQAFLHGVHAGMLQKARDEVSLLQTLKTQSGGNGQLQPWDRAFYVAMAHWKSSQALAGRAKRIAEYRESRVRCI